MKRTFLQIIISFFSGAILLCLLLLFFYTFPNLNILDKATSFGPFLEEGLKFLIILSLIRLINLKSKIIPVLGIGFGFAEAVSYLILHGFTNSSAYLTRIPFASLIHFVFGVIMAFFFYLAQKSRNKYLKMFWYISAFLIPSILHLFWNLLISK